MSTFHLFVRKQLVGAAQCCSVSPASQQSMLHRDIFIGYDKGTSTQTWFLGEKDFCKNFYASARGKAGINRKKSKGFYFGESYLHAVDTEMKFIANKNEDRLNRNQIWVWIHIIKSLTNFASKCSKIYAPLQRLFWSVGTECIVVALWYAFGKLCSIWCSLFWATPQSSEPRVKKRKMSRHSTKKRQLISQVKTKVMFEEKCQSNTQLNPYCFRKCQIHLWKTSHSSRSHRACNRGFCSNSTKRCLIGILWITSSLICRWHTILVLMKVWWSRTLKKKHSN